MQINFILLAIKPDSIHFNIQLVFLVLWMLESGNLFLAHLAEKQSLYQVTKTNEPSTSFTSEAISHIDQWSKLCFLVAEWHGYIPITFAIFIDRANWQKVEFSETRKS